MIALIIAWAKGERLKRAAKTQNQPDIIPRETASLAG